MSAAEPSDELRDQLAQWLWEAQLNSTSWDAIGDFRRDGFRRLADQALAGPLAPLLAKFAAVEALAKAWEDDSREWYYENRHTHEQGIHYVAGYEAGWEHADKLLRRALYAS